MDTEVLLVQRAGRHRAPRGARRAGESGDDPSGSEAGRPSPLDSPRRPRDWVRRAFSLMLLLCALGGTSLHGLGGTSPAAASDLEPPPSYSATRPLREDAALQAVAFRDRHTGLAVGDRGTILRTSDAGERWELVASGVACRLDAVRWVSSRRVVVVGGSYDRITGISRGVVLYSDDAGKRWRRADDAELPRLRRLREQPQEGVLVAEGDWSPVSLADQFESRDGGRTWHGRGEASEPWRPVSSSEYREWTESTGAGAIIRAACRGDDSHLWAVGEHGLIMHSANGGRTWDVQRGENRQTAILMVARSAARTAWPLVGREALERRHRVSLLLASGDPTDRGASEAPLDRARQALAWLGGGGADRLQPGDASSEALRRECINWISLHRPAVVVVDRSLPDATRSALTQAAIDAGAERVVSYSFGGRGQTLLHPNALMTSAGVFASDFSADALHLVAPSTQPRESISARRIYDGVGSPAGGDSVASGLSLSTGQSLAAAAGPAPRRRLQVAEARLHLRQQVDRMVSSRTSPESFREGLQAWLEQTPREDRFRLAWSLLQKCERAEDPRKQAVVLELLEQHFPARSVGRWASLRRESLTHSREWSRLSSLLTRSEPSRDQAAAEPVPVSPFQIPDNGSGGVVRASATSPLLVPERTPIEIAVGEEPAAQAAEAVDLAWEFHPLVLVAREAARRRGDDQSLQAAGEVSADLRRLLESSSAGPWQRLLRGAGRRVASAKRAEKPPRLDGIADDPCWPQQAVELGEELQLRLAYDDEFVYAAIRCASDAVQPDPAGSSSRPEPEHSRRARDHDLSSVDRLQLSLDLDRDLMTAMRLEFSAQGQTHDSVDGHRAWQPTWYVAPRRDGEHVHFELAILRRDLVELPLHPGQSWFLSLRVLAAGEFWRPAPMPSASQWIRIAFQ